jgi:hypothetical protein
MEWQSLDGISWGWIIGGWITLVAFWGLALVGIATRMGVWSDQRLPAPTSRPGRPQRPSAVPLRPGNRPMNSLQRSETLHRNHLPSA